MNSTRMAAASASTSVFCDSSSVIRLIVQPVSSGREANVLATAADGDGEVVVDDQRPCCAFIDDDRGHFGRARSAHDELRRIGRPQDDVDALAGQFVGHGLDPQAAQTDAGADRIDARVVRLDADLGAHAGIAGRALDFQRPSSISGTSSANSWMMNSGAVRQDRARPRAWRSI